jgi:hypothetical protein
VLTPRAAVRRPDSHAERAAPWFPTSPRFATRRRRLAV